MPPASINLESPDEDHLISLNGDDLNGDDLNGNNTVATVIWTTGSK